MPNCEHGSWGLGGDLQAAVAAKDVGVGEKPALICPLRIEGCCQCWSQFSIPTSFDSQRADPTWFFVALTNITTWMMSHQVVPSSMLFFFCDGTTW